jgi:hypothetical protein
MFYISNSKVIHNSLGKMSSFKKKKVNWKQNSKDITMGLQFYTWSLILLWSFKLQILDAKFCMNFGIAHHFKIRL